MRHIDQDCIYNHLETCQTISGVSESEDDTEADCGKIDIFVRTSNVKRLSDFLMWQVGEAWFYKVLSLPLKLCGLDDREIMET